MRLKSPSFSASFFGVGFRCLGAIAPTLILLVAASAPCAFAQRVTISLDGEWQVADSVSGEEIPATFDHSAPVPGLANLARPPFKDVDQFESMELIANRLRSKRLPESARVQTAGTTVQQRQYFWYRKTFEVPAKRPAATLKINKAQFGTAVWLNGKKLGEYPGCFSASYFDLADSIRWGEQNEVVIRIGAHPGVLPVTYPAGTDFEKLKWTPGIYDSVSLYFSGNPVIQSVQVAPRLEFTGPGDVSSASIVIQTRLRNPGAPCSATLVQNVSAWKKSKVLAAAEPLKIFLDSGADTNVTQIIPIPRARLWSLDDPFLYQLHTGTGGDSLDTRFGLREFHSRASTGKFYLNGKVCYLRGSNITLHRFFEDPECGALPWNDSWVRKLLADLPRKMHWNSFRFCIGPVPERWLEIADETGLLIQNEFFMWTGAPDWDRGYARHWDAGELKRQYSDWMRDNWNHPSVAIWDANNETLDPVFSEVINAVSGLDLSGRPWENSYNAPVHPDDPIEVHPYLYHPTANSGTIKFRMSDLETRNGKPERWYAMKEPHPLLINEYGWLWLNRDGTPTSLTQKLYPLLLGTNATPEQRLAFDAYTLAAETEYWRAHRQCAGVLHFVYLTCSYPGVFTSDHFRDVRKLELHPQFADYESEAFRPLGVCINFFHPTLACGQTKTFTVFLVNDTLNPVNGTVKLSLRDEKGRQLAASRQPFAMSGNGDTQVILSLEVPAGPRPNCILQAVAQAGHSNTERTLSRRWVDLVE